MYLKALQLQSNIHGLLALYQERLTVSLKWHKKGAETQEIVW